MSKEDEIAYALYNVIQSLIRLRGPKYNIGELVYAKYVGANVVIADVYYDEGWKYKFYGPSAVSNNDYYSTYPEDDLGLAREDSNE